MKARLLPIILFAIMLVPCTALAQERGHTGLVMGFPTNIGFIWHATDTLAIRPEVAFTHASGESESSVFGRSSSGDSDSLSVGASVLWYRGKIDNVRPYVAPRFNYGWASSEISSNATPVESRAFSVSASFGAQYAPARRFSVFGEIGYGFSRSTSEIDTPISSNKSTTKTWSPRSAVGVIFYFGN